MKYVFYADVFTMMNFMMDYLVLKVTGSILKENRHTTSYLLGAATGAVLLTLSLFIPIKFRIVNIIFSYFVISFVMCIVTFGIKSKREVMRRFTLLYAVAMGFGGIVNALYYFSDFQMKLKDRNLWTFLMIAGCSYIIMNEIVHIISIRTGRTGEKNDILKVRLCHHGVTLDTCGLFDSGNSLREPISGQPVHIIDYEAAEKIIKGGREKTGETIRVVPFHSMGREGGMLTAFLCDNVWIDRKGDYVNLGPAYIGIYRGKLSVTGQYHMILNRSINKWL